MIDDATRKIRSAVKDKGQRSQSHVGIGAFGEIGGGTGLHGGNDVLRIFLVGYDNQERRWRKGLNNPTISRAESAAGKDALRTWFTGIL